MVEVVVQGAGGGFGGEVLVLRAVQRGGQVHTACLHASVAVSGRYAGSTQA